MMMEESAYDSSEQTAEYELSSNCSLGATNAGSCTFEIAENTQIDWREFAVCLTFYALVLFFGIGLNVIVIIVVLRGKVGIYRQDVRTARVDSSDLDRPCKTVGRPTYRQSVLDDTLIFLSASDTLVIIICVPIRFARWFTYTWIFGEFLCKFVFYLQYWIAICSVLALMFITYQRYFAAAHPLAARSLWTARRRRMCLTLIWIIAAGLALPVLIGQIHKPVGESSMNYYWCLTEFSQPIYLLLFEAYLCIILIVLPLGTMISVYVCVLRKVSRNIFKTVHSSSNNCTEAHAVRRTMESRRSTVSSAKVTPTDLENRQLLRRRQFRRVFQLSVASVFVYALCWTPCQLDRLLSAAGVAEEYNLGWTRHLRMATTLLSHANSCLNPLVYCFLSTQFRQSVMRVFRQKDARRTSTFI